MEDVPVNGKKIPKKTWTDFSWYSSNSVDCNLSPLGPEHLLGLGNYASDRLLTVWINSKSLQKDAKGERNVAESTQSEPKVGKARYCQEFIVRIAC